VRLGLAVAAVTAAIGTAATASAQELAVDLSAGSVVHEPLATSVRANNVIATLAIRVDGSSLDLASDIVQDAFVRAYVNLAACRDPLRRRAWLFQTLRNRCRPLEGCRSAP
jgi:hypothetical protein